MTELECRPRGASRKDWPTPPLLDSPAWEVLIPPPQFIILAFVPVTLLMLILTTTSCRVTPTWVLPSHLQGGRRRWVWQSAGRCSSLIELFFLNLWDEGWGRQKTRWVVQKFMSKSPVVGQSEQVAISHTGSKKSWKWYYQSKKMLCEKNKKNTIIEKILQVFFNYKGMKGVKPHNHVLTLLLVLIIVPGRKLIVLSLDTTVV